MGKTHEKFTIELKERFLETLMNNGGIVGDAAVACNISRRALYNHRLKDTVFAKDWDDAVEIGVDVLEDECKRRALVGTDEDIFYQGEIVATVKKKSDYCLGLVLRARRAAYRNRTELSGPNGSPIDAKVIITLPANGREAK